MGLPERQNPVPVPQPQPGNPPYLRPGSGEMRVGCAFHPLPVGARPAPNAEEFPLAEQVSLPEEQIIAVLVTGVIYFPEKQATERMFFHGVRIVS